MTTPSSFPRELLSEPIEIQIQYCENKVIAHPRLMETHNTLMQAVHQPAGAGLILVYGPTGVGKTTLRMGIQKQLLEESRPDMERNPGHIPVVGMEVIAPESGTFNWRDYYIRALTVLDEPLIECKIDYNVRGLYRRNGGLVAERSVVVSELRRALEQCLRHRRLGAFIVDEAQHLKKMVNGRRLLDQMDTIKSLANMTGTVHVLVGTYELLDFACLSAQLSRRSIEIHFPRYRFDGEDIQTFKNILLTFQRQLPLPEEPDLVASYEYLYAGCVGCIGVLKNWLQRALAMALRDGQKTLPRSYLEHCAEPEPNLLCMAREIKEGEDLLKNTGGQRTEVQALLGMGTDPISTVPAGSEQANPQPKRQKGRVGQRNPVRDKIGA
jgi:hypothetical protein